MLTIKKYIAGGMIFDFIDKGDIQSIEIKREFVTIKFKNNQYEMFFSMGFTPKEHQYNLVVKAILKKINQWIEESCSYIDGKACIHLSCAIEAMLVENVTNTINLNLLKGDDGELKPLVGKEYGELVYKEQIKPKMDLYTTNVIVIDESIKNISLSFLQGLREHHELRYTLKFEANESVIDKIKKTNLFGNIE